MNKEDLIKMIQSVNSNEITYVSITFKASTTNDNEIEIRYNS